MAEKTTYEELEQRICDLVPGDHLCCIYETEEERRAWLIPFIRQGLEHGERVLYILDAHTAEEILNYLSDWKQNPIWKGDNWSFFQLMKHMCSKGSLILMA